MILIIRQIIDISCGKIKQKDIVRVHISEGQKIINGNGNMPNLSNRPNNINCQNISCKDEKKPNQLLVGKQKHALKMYKDTKASLDFLQDSVSKSIETPLRDSYNDYIKNINQLNNSTFEELNNLNLKLKESLEINEEERLLEEEAFLKQLVDAGFLQSKSETKNRLNDAKQTINQYFNDLLSKDDAIIVSELRNLDNGVQSNVFNSLDKLVNESMKSRTSQAQVLTKLISSSLFAYKEANKTFTDLQFKEFGESIKLLNEKETTENKFTNVSTRDSLLKRLKVSLDTSVIMNRFMLLQVFSSYIERATGLKIDESTISSSLRSSAKAVVPN